MTTASKQDYTTGSLTGHFLRLMIPLVIGNILQQLYNAVDSIVISRYASSQEFAAVGIASSFMNLFLFALIGACTGLSILLAQAHGAGNVKLFRKYHGLAVIYGTAAVLCLSLLLLCFLPSFLSLLQTPEELKAYTLRYLRIILGGLLISYLYNFYAALLRSIGRANVALLALFAAVLLNLALDLFFIAGLRLGITGAAAATMIAQVSSVLLCLAYLQRSQRQVLFAKEDYAWDKSLVRKMLHISLVTGIHQVSLYMGKLFIQTFINGAGTDMIMAYTATTRIEGFANSFGDSGSAVTSIIAAQNYGARNTERVRHIFRISLCILAVFGVLSAGILYLAAPAAVSLMLRAGSPAFTAAVSYLHIVSLFYLFCFTGNTFAGYFEGIGKVQVPFIGALSHMTLRVILSFFWVPVKGLDAVAAATGIGWILVNIGWSVYYKTHDRLHIS